VYIYIGTNIQGVLNVYRDSGLFNSDYLHFCSVYIGTNIQGVLNVYRDSGLFNSDYLHFFQFVFVTVGNCGDTAFIFGLCAQFLHFLLSSDFV
jgi:hypothetical protein